MAHELILKVGATCTGVSNGASQSLEVILVPPSDILSGSKLAIARSKPRFRLDPSNNLHKPSECTCGVVIE